MCASVHTLECNLPPEVTRPSSGSVYRTYLLLTSSVCTCVDSQNLVTVGGGFLHFFSHRLSCGSIWSSWKKLDLGKRAQRWENLEPPGGFFSCSENAQNLFLVISRVNFENVSCLPPGQLLINNNSFNNFQTCSGLVHRMFKLSG